MFITSDCCAAGKNLRVRASGSVLPQLVSGTHVPLCALWLLSPPAAGPAMMRMLQVLAGGIAVTAKVISVALQVLDSGLITWWCFQAGLVGRKESCSLFILLVGWTRLHWRYHGVCRKWVNLFLHALNPLQAGGLCSGPCLEPADTTNHVGLTGGHILDRRA